jgi:hypothetical protein
MPLLVRSMMHPGMLPLPNGMGAGSGGPQDGSGPRMGAAGLSPMQMQQMQVGALALVHESALRAVPNARSGANSLRTLAATR